MEWKLRSRQMASVYGKNRQAWAFWHWLVVIGLALSLTACGFHLKGTGPNAVAGFESIKFESTGGVRPDILRALKMQLTSTDVKVVDNAAQAEVILRFSPTQYTTSRTSISGQGDAASELIKMAQPIHVQEVATEKDILDTSVQAFRDRRIDNSAALASNRELMSIQQQMAADIASQIIDRINRARAEPAK
jgi:LPS-assembly lipoprotein